MRRRSTHLHLTRLAQYVDNRVGELVAAVGRRVGDNRLLVMASLLIADELSDAYGELETLRESNQGIAKRMEAEETLTGLLEGWRIVWNRLRIASNRAQQLVEDGRCPVRRTPNIPGAISLPREPSLPFPWDRHMAPTC